MSDDQTILISCPVNGGAELIYDQILAYNQAVSNCIHVIHISRDSMRAGFLEELDATPYDFRKIPNVLVSDHKLFSRRPTLLGIHAMNLEFALRRRLSFGHVYLHTATDLPFRRGLGEHIRQFDFGLEAPRIKHPGATTGWGPAIDNHLPFQRMLADFGPETPVYTNRYEGFFATRGLFFEFLSFMMAHIPFTRDEVWRGDYPYEEFMLPTVVELLTQDRDLKRTRHAVRVGTTDKLGLARGEALGEKHIPKLQKWGPDIFSLKVAPPLDSPLRAWVREQLGYEWPVFEAKAAA